MGGGHGTAAFVPTATSATDHKARGIRITRLVAMVGRLTETASMGWCGNRRLHEGNYVPQHAE
jgi:hypothetical protein